MAYEIKVPDLGDGVVGKILTIHVKVGDTITKDTIIADINTDKVDAEVPAEVEGTITEIRIKVGDEAKMGDVMMIISTGVTAAVPTESTPAAPVTAAPVPASGGAEIDLTVPDLGDGVVGKILNIHVKVGDTVAADTIIADINTDKVDAEVPADAAGVVTAILLKVGDEAKLGDVIMRIQSATAAPAAAVVAPTPAPVVETAGAPPAVAQTVSTTQVVENKAVSNESSSKRTSPLAKKLARELGVDLSKLGGADGRISKLDVINAYAKKQAPASGGSAAVAYKKLPDFAKYGAIRKESMSRIMEVTAENMSYAWSTVPHAWILEKVDITDVEKLRNKHKDAVKAKGAGLTITAIIAKAVAKALLKHPFINATCDMENKEIIFKDHVHIGIAVDTPRGLLVPIIRDCDKKSIFEIAQDLSELSVRTRDGKNKATDMEGATFTISNVGGIGGTGILPIVNTPQGAILGVTGSEIEGVWNGSAFEPRLRMQMTIGFDHRIINGAEATRFLQTVKNNLEDPFLMNLY
jgi:pyruvate dehydrogenase E2 component (dihydrolipoamide acetyltransferase)